MLQRGYSKHPKIAALSDAAFRLWQAANDYCDTLLTDGVIHKTALSDRSIAARSSPKLVAELLKIIPPYKAGLWEDHGDYYLVHDYLDWNDSREIVQASRARGRERSARFRAKHQDGDGAPHAERDGVTNGARNGARNGVTNTVTNGARNGGIDRSIDRDLCTEERTGGLAPAVPSSPVENSPEAPVKRKPAFYQALMHRVLDAYPKETDEGELIELVKTACSRAGALYDTETVRKALDAALAIRRQVQESLGITPTHAEAKTQTRASPTEDDEPDEDEPTDGVTEADLQPPQTRTEAPHARAS